MQIFHSCKKFYLLTPSIIVVSEETFLQKGYIQEIFSSFQGEGSAFEGSCYGLRQIFVRFAGCPLALGKEGTTGCVWCDSPQAQREHPKQCSIETGAGSQQFTKKANPMIPKDVLDNIQQLTTKDLHSISLTGGEPLHQPKFLKEIILNLKQKKYKIFLETAYAENLQFLEEIARNIDFACVDIKDKSAKATTKWEELVEREVKMCRILRDAGTKVFSKIVLSKSSKISDFELVAKLCGEVNIPMAIQLVSPTKKSNAHSLTWDQLVNFTETAAKYLPPEKIGISAQVHKLLNIL